MKINRTVLATALMALSLLPLAPRVHCQEKQPTEAPQATPVNNQTPVKLQILLTEFDGTKKVSSMPYTMNLVTTAMGHHEPGSFRVGVRVPTGTAANVIYMDLGTSIDCWVWPWTDGRYLVNGRVDTSSAYNGDSWSAAKEAAPENSTSKGYPLVRQTRADFSIPLRDGQSGEAISATDPITGRVLKVEITLSVAK